MSTEIWFSIWERFVQTFPSTIPRSPSLSEYRQLFPTGRPSKEEILEKRLSRWIKWNKETCLSNVPPVQRFSPSLTVLTSPSRSLDPLWTFSPLSEVFKIKLKTRWRRWVPPLELISAQSAEQETKELIGKSYFHLRTISKLRSFISKVEMIEVILFPPSRTARIYSHQ